MSHITYFSFVELIHDQNFRNTLKYYGKNIARIEIDTNKQKVSWSKCYIFNQKKKKKQNAFLYDYKKVFGC